MPYDSQNPSSERPGYLINQPRVVARDLRARVVPYDSQDPSSERPGYLINQLRVVARDLRARVVPYDSQNPSSERPGYLINQPRVVARDLRARVVPYDSQDPSSERPGYLINQLRLVARDLRARVVESRENAPPQPRDSLATMSSDRPIHVLCARPFNDAQLARLRAVSPRLVIEQRPVRMRAELASILSPEIEVLFSIVAPLSMENLPNLRWFQCRSAGMNAIIDTPVWHAPHVALTTASGVHSITMAEYTTGMMVALARDFLGFLSYQRRSEWPMKPKNHHEQFPGRELRGATVTIVGYGSIGREIGRQCAALGMRVLAVKRDPTRSADSGFFVPGTGDPGGVIPERIVGPAQLDEVLPGAEYVVLCTALTPANQGLVREEHLRLMRRDAFLINIARGGVVDESALLRALKEKWIAGAALDVFATEPLPADSPLWSMDNVILSPHVSGVTPRYDEHLSLLFAENLHRYVAGEPLLNLVDRNLGY